MFLSIFSILRLYTLIRLYRFAATLRLRRVWKMFKGRNIYSFIYKISSSESSVLFYFLMLIVFLFFSSFIYSSAENLKDELLSMWEAFWIIEQTIMGIGYGDFYPYSIVSQVMCIIIVFLGKFFVASFQLSLIYCVSFNEEREIKAYQQIKLLDSKEDKSNSYNIYFENYIKYKMIKVKNLALDTLPLQENEKTYNNYMKMLKLKNSVKVIKEKYFLRVLSTLRNDITVCDFISYVKHNMECEVSSLLEKYLSVFMQMYKYNCAFVDTISSFYSNVTDVSSLSNKVANLALIVYWTGCSFIIDNQSSINKYKIASQSDFEVKLREFFLINKDKYLTRHRSKKSGTTSHILRKTSRKGSDVISITSGFENFHFFPPFGSTSEANMYIDSDDDIEDDDEEEEEGEEDECILYKTEDSYIEMGQAKDSSDSDSS